MWPSDPKHSYCFIIGIVAFVAMVAELDVNGGGEVSSSPKDLSNGHANADGSYGFANGNDIVSDDPLQTDLDADSNSAVEFAIKQSKINNVNDEGDMIQDSVIIDVKGDADQGNEPLESSLGNQGVNVERNIVLNEFVDKNNCVPQPNESSENTKISADAAVQISVSNPSGELGREAASGAMADANLKTLVVSDPATDETEHARETLASNGLGCDSQEATTVQLNDAFEIANGTLPDVPVIINETTTEPDSPVSISETTTGPPPIELGASTIDENLPSTETEAPKFSDFHPVDKTMVDNKVENSFVGTDDSIPETGAGTASMVLKEKESTLTNDDSNLKSIVLEGVTLCVDSQMITVDNAAVESSISGSKEEESCLPTCPSADLTSGDRKSVV